MFRAQLKQVDSMSIGKVNGVTQVYRTKLVLLRAYEELELEVVVQDLALMVDSEQSMRVACTPSKQVLGRKQKHAPLPRQMNHES
mmetsp:Transcript_24689/g.25108  ORF Transcript_24689/g.25108 Transcript_24689/m.25108 type:complete len:85 (+) Transcript_24689:804-1058(+)|eukprot:CAMPEP_0171317582 /NCGR_PEP_ID=MMETSP0816-20121228/81774_1 /TAXON_ID=420281 /ORGANISM="Proboscia inermis, Strain CCAP1064/1" /LENGTH=84 /DNA_ID=CAMNT_0011811015 /DNA_START=753 /DNA_END=1007 /DNA_ORIENTATION=+